MGLLAPLGVNMVIGKDSELHRRRARRNIFLGLVLGGFVAVVFGTTMVKLKQGMELKAMQQQQEGAGQ